MASVKAGVVTAVDVNGPINSGGSPGPLFDLSSGSTWAVLWFAVSVIVLFVIL